MGIHWKIQFLGMVNKKPIYRGELPKKGGLGHYADLRGAWRRRRGWCFLGGLIPQCTLCKILWHLITLKIGYFLNKAYANDSFFVKPEITVLLQPVFNCFCSRMSEVVETGCSIVKFPWIPMYCRNNCFTKEITKVYQTWQFPKRVNETKCKCKLGDYFRSFY